MNETKTLYSDTLSKFFFLGGGEVEGTGGLVWGWNQNRMKNLMEFPNSATKKSYSNTSFDFPNFARLNGSNLNVETQIEEGSKL